MVKLRLAQYGSSNRRTYRIVAIEEGSARNGQPIEVLGYYNPLTKPAELKVDNERVAYWIKNGAQMTDGVSKILKTA